MKEQEKQTHKQERGAKATHPVSEARNKCPGCMKPRLHKPNKSDESGPPLPLPSPAPTAAARLLISVSCLGGRAKCWPYARPAGIVVASDIHNDDEASRGVSARLTSIASLPHFDCTTRSSAKTEENPRGGWALYATNFEAPQAQSAYLNTFKFLRARGPVRLQFGP